MRLRFGLTDLRLLVPPHTTQNFELNKYELHSPNHIGVLDIYHIQESCNTDISHQPFNYKITFVNSQRENGLKHSF